MEDLLRDQDGVVARWQLAKIGVADHDIRRLLRRRRLTSVHPGVYVDHSGEPTWSQRAWAGVLHAWPAALSGPSALRIGSSARPDDDTVHVMIDHARRVRARPGLVVHRRLALDEVVLWNLGPPRVRLEEAVIDTALAARDVLTTIAVLADACGSRRTTAARLLDTVRGRARVPRRRWIEEVLRDVADGTCSVLEHGFLTRVERPHGLPAVRRQLRAVGSTGIIHRDAEVAGMAIIELDGRLFHGSASARDRDIERDLDASLDGLPTVRLGWGQVYDRPCSTAAKIARLLTSHGWDGALRPCGPTCATAGNIAVTRWL